MIQKCIAYWYSECLLLSLHVQPYQSLKWSVFSPSLLRCVSFVKIDVYSWHNSVFNCVFAELSVIREQKTFNVHSTAVLLFLGSCSYDVMEYKCEYYCCISIFSVLHGMPARTSDEKGVRPSDNAWFVTNWKKDLSRFLYHTKDRLA